ncbi:MAG: UDP-N-acetylmuramate dehydrogenase [Clostridia bacterium]|nr:UDP-N-acetylmuramate dehydrogenase [Clostridia bacterium]
MTAYLKALSEHKIEYTENCPMSSYTSFKIGGPADVLVSPKTEEELTLAVSLARESATPYMLLGKGSNLLVSDLGIEGAVIHLSEGLDKITLIEKETVCCGAGASLAALCNFCHSEGLSGLEFAYGIPGSVGGAVYMNAGAYCGEMKDVLVSVKYLTPDGEIKMAVGDELDLSYRHSRFSGKRDVILSAEFKLKEDNAADIRARMDDYIGRRKDKQPLNFPSAGSVFKRPEGHFAGALVEQSGLKGYTVGGAQVSEKHAGFIINVGGATCSDVLALIEHIKSTVKANFGVELENEVIKTGR